MRKFWRVLRDERAMNRRVAPWLKTGVNFRMHTSCALIFIMLCGVAFGLSGGGVEGDPWVIGSVADFDEFAGDSAYWGGYVRLDVDIDLGGRIYSTAVIAPDTGNTNWDFEGVPFQGVFDGNGHVIINLTIDTAGEGNDYLGLFGCIKGYDAGVYNLVLENVNISGGNFSNFLGGLCGRNDFGTISKCDATVSVTGGDKSSYLGVVCGSSNGMIGNCYATGPINGGDNSHRLGGLCGGNTGTISNCYATGPIKGGDNSHRLGGLCGGNGDGSIINSYATGSVTGGDISIFLGGLCGNNSTGTISNCYASGSVTGGVDTVYLGGLCGSNSLGAVSNCVFLDPVDGGGADNGIGTSLVNLQMKQLESFIHWDFVDETANGTSEIWQMPTGGGFPVLSIFNRFTPVSLDGEGTDESPYLISNSMELGAMYHYSSHAFYRLENDIELTGITWSAAVVPVFGGCFDGNGHVLHNLKIEGGGYLGLFGTIFSLVAEIKNLGMESIAITGGHGAHYIGGVFAKNWAGGTVINCYSVGSVSGGDESWYLGGLCGYNSGTVSNSYSSCSVAGNEYIGGICGHNSGNIIKCYASGSVTGVGSSWRIGGLCGRSSGTIRNCFATGPVTGRDYLGGLCGWNYGGTFTNCYATGSVSGRDYLGGLCGKNENGMVSNCYATGSVTGGDDSDHLGGLCGWIYSSRSIIKNCYANGLVSGGENSYYLGGLCGYNNGGILIDSSATGPVNGGDHSYRLGGLCGYNNLGAISNCIASGPVDSKDNSRYLGGLCGHNEGNLIFNCSAIGSVTSGDNSFYLGGLCGENEVGGSISVCFATGSVTAGVDSGSLGGLCGRTLGGNISKSYSTGSVECGDNSNHLGGLCGYNSYGTISNCYTTGSVNGGDNSQYLGGLAGKNTRGTIMNCYVTGPVTSGNYSKYIFALCGYQYGSSAEILNCFWDTQTSGKTVGYFQDRSYPGTITNVIGKNTEEMQTLSTFVDFGWDFVGESGNGDEDVWRMCVDGVEYPRLSWEYSSGGDYVCGDGVGFGDLAFFADRWLVGGDFGFVEFGVLSEGWGSD